MLTLRGKFANGEIELLDPAPGQDECFVLVTFVNDRQPEARPASALPINGDFEVLTPRERDVLRLMPTGRNNREIAQKLGISEGTTRNYISRIYRKLDANNRAEAVAKAVRRDLILLD